MPKTMTVAEFKKQKPSKYRNKRVEVDGIRFDSKKEASRYRALMLYQSHGEISNLERQVSYDLTVNGELICRYRADFRYIAARGTQKGRECVEDVKGIRTPVYQLKKKLMKAIHGIEIQEV
jgi:hypothetical protein